MKFYEGSIGDKMARLKGGKLSLSDVLRLDKHTARSLVFALQKLNAIFFLSFLLPFQNVVVTLL